MNRSLPIVSNKKLNVNSEIMISSIDCNVRLVELNVKISSIQIAFTIENKTNSAIDQKIILESMYPLSKSA
ncbi:hypothetical protein SanaruYs_16570 [Chryseotalea sanaruensis]|uniref:Uncharacterized protein n=1 Tax=Chryseotalea sanaruensis TaxID=2482724 RepID=A0A401U968_9BACT|nr:hypothetical protein SanaruYs_16570 [Chryseotalea sanaruensis]